MGMNPPHPQAGGAVPLDQLKALRMQQQAQKAQLVLNVSIQFMCNKVVESSDQALILAAEHVNKWERMFNPNEAQNKGGC